VSRLAAGLILQHIPIDDAIMAGNKTFQMMTEPTSAQSSTEDLRQRNVNREKTIGGTGEYSRDGENSGSGQDRLDRYLSSKPIVAFGLTLQASWEAIAISFQSVLVNGGPSTLVYGMILSIFGSTAMAATLAELASMKPCVGAQYRWTAMLAPRGTDPRFWGFIQGYLTVFAWNFACALNPFLMGGMIQGCITLCDSSYVPKGWHTMLLSWASMALPIFCNVYARRILAPLEIAAAILHVLGFIVFVVVLVVMARRSTSDFVFETAFYGQSGWENKGVQWSIGLLAVIFPIGGYDSILHMADEVKDAPRKIPLAMVWATITSGIIGFAFIIVLLFCLGYVPPSLPAKSHRHRLTSSSDLEKVTNTPTMYPIIEVLYEATGSKAGTVFMMMIIYFVIGCSQFNILASVSRLTWYVLSLSTLFDIISFPLTGQSRAFARDRGYPFPDTFSKVHPTLRIPVNAVLITSTICIVINIIPVGSTVAFYAL
jgi:choline transport protein